VDDLILGQLPISAGRKNQRNRPERSFRHDRNSGF
jgi:hypothetical protein